MQRTDTDKVLEQFDIDLMLKVSLDYFIGRRTAMLHWFCDNIIRAWPALSDDLKMYVKMQVEKAFVRDDYSRRDQIAGTLPLGDDIDRRAWERVRQLWG